MTSPRLTRVQDERGAALFLVIAFMVVMGSISAAVISTAASGIQERVVLDQARNREYAADAAIETTIAAARALDPTLLGTCPPPASAPFNLNNVPGGIHVDCTSVPAVIVGHGVPKLQKNLSFSACIWTGPGTFGAPCTTATTIITAQVNFQVNGPTVTTYVQAWSVNG